MGRSVCNRNLILGPNVSLNLKFYIASEDNPSSGFHKGCPVCLEAIHMPNVCVNPDCKNHDKSLDYTVKIYKDDAATIMIDEKDLEEIAEKMKSAKDFVVVSNLTRQETTSHLANSIKKYYLVPNGHGSSHLYSALLYNMAIMHNGLMVKFTIKKGNEYLGIIKVQNDNPKENVCLVLHVIPFASAVRPAPQITMPTELPKDYLQTVKGLLNAMPVSNYDDTVDDYSVKLNELVNAKVLEHTKKAAQGTKFGPAVLRTSKKNAIISLATGKAVESVTK